MSLKGVFIEWLLAFSLSPHLSRTFISLSHTTTLVTRQYGQNIVITEIVHFCTEVIGKRKNSCKQFSH